MGSCKILKIDVVVNTVLALMGTPNRSAAPNMIVDISNGVLHTTIMLPEIE